MPRRLLKKILPAPHILRQRWPLRVFGERIADPQLWTLHRRACTYAFGAGLAICFVPLPVHLLLAVSVAMVWRVNIPVTYGTTWLLTNPFTAVPVYYLAYRVGAALLHTPKHHFRFVADLNWFRHSLTPVWEPFALGCLVCALVTSVLGWLTLDTLWRWSVRSRYRTRHEQPGR
ncbi:MAG: DUF2062 domain-containing protein [Steroidobacteraceae bacterium]